MPECFRIVVLLEFWPIRCIGPMTNGVKVRNWKRSSLPPVPANLQRLFIVIAAVSPAHSCQACARDRETRDRTNDFSLELGSATRDFRAEFPHEAQFPALLCNRGTTKGLETSPSCFRSSPQIVRVLEPSS